MEDKQFEELLRESWEPEPPDGMRERVMNRAQAELGRRTFQFPWPEMPRWQVGLALTGVLILLVCGMSSISRETRLAALESSDYAQPRIFMAQRPMSMGIGRAQLFRLLDDPTSELIVP